MKRQASRERASESEFQSLTFNTSDKANGGKEIQTVPEEVVRFILKKLNIKDQHSVLCVNSYFNSFENDLCKQWKLVISDRLRTNFWTCLDNKYYFNRNNRECIDDFTKFLRTCKRNFDTVKIDSFPRESNRDVYEFFKARKIINVEFCEGINFTQNSFTEFFVLIESYVQQLTFNFPIKHVFKSCLAVSPPTKSFKNLTRLTLSDKCIQSISIIEILEISPIKQLTIKETIFKRLDLYITSFEERIFKSILNHESIVELNVDSMVFFTLVNIYAEKFLKPILVKRGKWFEPSDFKIQLNLKTLKVQGSRWNPRVIDSGKYKYNISLFLLTQRSSLKHIETFPFSCKELIDTSIQCRIGAEGAIIDSKHRVRICRVFSLPLIFKFSFSIRPAVQQIGEFV